MAGVFAASFAVAAEAQAAPQFRVKNTGGSFAASVRAEPGETLEFQMFGNNTSSGAFSVTLPSDLSYTATAFSAPAASTSSSGQTVTWNFNTASNAVIRFTATVAAGGSLGANHTLNVTFSTDTAATSDTATVTTGPIVTGINPSSCNNANAVPFNGTANGCTSGSGIAGHGFTGATSAALSLNGTSADLTFDLAGATITDTLIYGPSIRVPASFTPGQYWVLVTVTSSGNTLTTNGDATETVRYTATDGIPPQMQASSNAYVHSTGALMLNFDETIDVSATDKTKITLADASSGGNSLTLDNATVSTTDSATVTFTLAQADINTISTWGQSVNTLYAHIAGSGIYDTSGNPLSNQGSRTSLNTWTKDTTQPTATVTYTQNSAAVTSAKAGALTVTVTFNEPITTAATPQIAINQQGTTDIGATNLTLSGTDRTAWTYAYTVNLDDASAYLDGSATITVSAATDYAGLTLSSTSNGTFTIDTLVPSPAIATLAASSSGQTQANFSWTPTYSASDFSTYKFYWSTSSGVTSANGTLIDKNTSGYSSLGASSAGALALSSLSAGTNYYAVIYICDAAANCSLSSNQASAQTQQNAVITSPVSGGGGGSGQSAPTTYQTYNPSTGELTTGAQPPAETEGQVLGSTVGAYPNGTLLKAPGSSAVWYIAGDEKRLIRSAAIFESQFNWNDIINLPSSRQLELYAQGADVPFAAGALVKEMGSPAVYRVNAAGSLQPIISEEVFLAAGLSFSSVVEVEEGFLAAYPVSAYITNADAAYRGDAASMPRAIQDGALVKGDSSSVYAVSDGKKRPIVSAQDFEALLYKWENVRTVPQNELDAIPLGPALQILQ